MPFSLIYFFAPISIFYIPHNYVIPQAMPHAIPQTHSVFYPHRFSITFFMGNCKPQTAKCHVTTALRSRLQFAVHVWTAGRASSSKWFTATFSAIKNCTASRLKVWTGYLYPFAVCLLHFWARINELLLSFVNVNVSVNVAIERTNIHVLFT